VGDQPERLLLGLLLAAQAGRTHELEAVGPRRGLAPERDRAAQEPGRELRLSAPAREPPLERGLLGPLVRSPGGLDLRARGDALGLGVVEPLELEEEAGREPSRLPPLGA